MLQYSVDAFFQVRKTKPSLWTREALQSRVSRKRRGMLAQGHTVQFASKNPFQVFNKKTTIVFPTTGCGLTTREGELDILA